MKYQLGLLDEAAKINAELQLSDGVVSDLILDFKKEAFEINTTEGLLLFIQNHHKALKAFEQNPVTEGATSTILYFLETVFTAYLNHDLTVSTIWQKQFFAENSAFLVHILDSAKKALSPEVYILFDKLINPQFRLTVHQINYLESFCKSWQEETINPLQDEREFLYFLYKSNLNSIGFFNHVINCTKRELETHDSIEVQLEYLKLYMEELSRYTDVKPYIPTLPSIKTQVANWLKSEHASLTTRLSKQSNQPIKAKTDVKFQTSVTLAELVCMFKMFKDKGIIVNKTEKEIYVGISKYFSTPKAENISEESARNKYYQNDLTVIESVKSLLLNTVRKI